MQKHVDLQTRVFHAETLLILMYNDAFKSYSLFIKVHIVIAEGI